MRSFIVAVQLDHSKFEFPFIRYKLNIYIDNIIFF